MEFFTYDPLTGTFTGRRGFPVGGNTKKGYLFLAIGAQQYFAHRLAWLYVHGEMPQGFIDHINHVKTDNRIENLRVVTVVQNNIYRRGLDKNKLKAKGVRQSKEGTYEARIGINKKRLSLGTYKTSDEAAHAYNKAAIAAFGEFAVLNPIGADK